MTAHPEPEERLRALALAAKQASETEPTKDVWTVRHATIEVYQEEASPSAILALLDELTRLRASLAEAEQDSKRLEWIGENATSVSDGYDADGELSHLAYSTHGRVLLLEVKLPTVPREEKDWLRAALDRAALHTAEDTEK